MNPPLITTIILTYRRPVLLARALRSVLAQTFKDLTVRVYDDASGDNTAEVVAAFAAQDPRVVYHRHAINLGAVANYNYALARVDTPYFSMLSDDDVLLPEFYDRAMEGLTKYPSAGCFCARTLVYQTVDKRLQVKPTSWRSGYHDASLETILHMIRDHFPTTGILFKREVMDKVGEFNRFASDHIYITQAASSFPVVASDYEAGIFTVHPTSITGGNSRLSGGRPPDGSSFEATEEWLLFFLTTLVNLKERNSSERMRLVAALYKLSGKALASDCLHALAAEHFEDFRFALQKLRLLRFRSGLRTALLGTGLLFPRIAALTASAFLKLKDRTRRATSRKSLSAFQAMET